MNTAHDINDGDMDNVRRNLSGMNRGPIAELWHKVTALWQMVRDPDAPKAGKLMALAALVYLVVPFDGVPDPIPVLGLLDDAAVITATVRKLASDLKRYLNS